VLHAAFVRVVELQAGPFVVDAVAGAVGGGAGGAAPGASADRFGREVVDRHAGWFSILGFGGVGGLAPDRTGRLRRSLL